MRRRTGRAVSAFAATFAVIWSVAVAPGGARSWARAAHPTAPARTRADRPGVVDEWGQFGGGQGRLAGLGRDGRLAAGSPFGVGPVRDVPQVVKGLHGTITQIATSNSDGYALTSDGSVYAWGPGGQGELGDGSQTRLAERAVRVRLPAGTRIASLANPMPYDGAMAIAADGTVWAWGNDRARDFCEPRGSILTAPVKVPLTHVTLAVGALRHAIFDAAGRIVSCGAGPTGQLGNGTAGPRAAAADPVAVRGLPLGRAVALTSAWGNAGVLMADGDYYDWGFNAGGQVGDGVRRRATTAVRVPLPGRVTVVFAGGSYRDNGQTVAILADGTFWDWGTGGFGQLGDGRTAPAVIPFELTPPDGVRFVAASSGGSTTYAIDTRGQLWDWGNNRVGQLGIGSPLLDELTPIRCPVDALQVSSTAHNVVALVGGQAAGQSVVSRAGG